VTVKRIGLFVKNEDKAEKKADELESWLKSKGFDVLRKEGLPSGLKVAGEKPSVAPSDLLCIFVLGGDGTFLSAVRWIGDQPIPILGVKFGEVGFLAEIAEDKLFSVAEKIINTQFEITPRMRLQVELNRRGEVFVQETVLNDVVINKGALARLAHIRTYVDGQYLTTYKADGLIVATPTGSTAYSLAAGGPILHPGVPAIIMTPISPFTLTNRPLIIPDSACITIRLEEKSEDIMLTFDGQAGLEIDEKDTIIVRKGKHPINMIIMPGQEYFDVLKAKLRWSGGRV
jgi:NAD+ kinase